MTAAWFLSKEFEQGKKAFQDNIHIWRNPHPLDSAEFHAWKDGWLFEAEWFRFVSKEGLNYGRQSNHRSVNTR